MSRSPWRAISTCGFALCCVLGLPGFTVRADDRAAEPDLKAELPRIAPVEPAAALATFRVAPGFRIEQVAAEPLVADPVALAFDANSRLYVVEMCDYSEQFDERLGMVRLLEDTDQDGRFDKSTVFVDKLAWPTAVTCYDGGVFIGSVPDILYCKDTDGDGRADIRRVVYSGFDRANVQGLLNSFTWGLDNRIEGAAGRLSNAVRRADVAGARPVTISGRDFSFDPRSLELIPTSGGGQYGMSFDDWGRKFVCSNSDHIQQVMFEDRYIARNPYLAAPSPRVSIAADGPAAEIYRASPIEPWRLVRTRLRVAGTIPGPIEGGGRAAGYFTSASGIAIYRGSAAPDLVGMAVVGEACGGLVHRKSLAPAPGGLQLVARRIDDRSEFVASTDIWFRPVQLFNAPDGALYIADMYREVIEHPASLAPMIKKHLDLTSGRDRGRIYRVVPEGFSQPRLPRLAEASTAELVRTLEHPNAWHRETAARLLYERKDAQAVPLLVSLAFGSLAPLGRMHALYALDGLNALTEPALARGLDDAHPGVRVHAIRLSEHLTPRSPALDEKLCTLVADDDPQVRYQLAFTLGSLTAPRRLDALAALAKSDGASPWVRIALLSSVAEGASDLFALLVVDLPFRGSDPGRQILASLANQVALRGRAGELNPVIGMLEALPAQETPLARLITVNVANGLARGGHSLVQMFGDELGGKAKAVVLLRETLASARTLALDEKRPSPRRVEAINMLVLGAFTDVSSLFGKLVDPHQGQDVQQAALAALARFTEPEVTAVLLEAWPRLSPRLRAVASDALFARPNRLPALLDAIEQGKLSPAELESARIAGLLSHPDPTIRDRAQRLLGVLKPARRQDVVDAYQPVLSMRGDAARGKQTFQKICAACHRAEGVGQEIGPNLATSKNKGAEFLLLNVLDPSREVNPEYLNYSVAMDDGRILTGLIAGETATSLTLRRAEGISDTILRINVEELRSTGLSLMPEGLEKEIDPQAMADLMAYLLGLN